MVCFPASEVRSYHTCITGTHKVNKVKQKTVAHITKSTFKQRLCGEGSRTIPDSKLNFYGTITELLKIQVHFWMNQIICQYSSNSMILFGP